MNIDLHYLRWKIRREAEKKFKGYLSEAAIYSAYASKPNKLPQNKFVIWTYQRTGSTLLVSLLNSHPLIQCDGEILLNRMISPLKYMHRRSLLADKDIYGFKLQISHLYYQKIYDPANFINEVHKSRFKIIKLIREDILRTAISLQYATTTGRFHFLDNNPTSQVIKINLDPALLLKNIQWIETSQASVNLLVKDLPHLEIVYERDLVSKSARDELMERICAYLGIQYNDVNSPLIKALPDDIEQFVINFQEILEFLGSTPYAKYCTDYRA